MQLRDQGAVVTGGASGLGAATARALASRGARVTIFDLDPARGAEVAQAVGGTFASVDVRDEAQVEAGLATATEAHGCPRVLVGCAGIGAGMRVVGRAKPHPLDVFQQVIDVNLVGMFNVLRLTAQAMSSAEPDADGERGVIVNTASIAAYEGQIGQAAYAASKGGIVSLTLPVARDLASLGIRVCTIAPGLFDTPLMAGLPEAVRESLAAGTPFPRRLGQPEEFADLACHICENSMLNGEVIRLDGAVRMAPR